MHVSSPVKQLIRITFLVFLSHHTFMNIEMQSIEARTVALSAIKIREGGYYCEMTNVGT